MTKLLFSSNAKLMITRSSDTDLAQIFEAENANVKITSREILKKELFSSEVAR